MKLNLTLITQYVFLVFSYELHQLFQRKTSLVSQFFIKFSFTSGITYVTLFNITNSMSFE